MIERDIAQDQLASADGFSSSPPGATCPCKKPPALHAGIFFDGTGNNMFRDRATTTHTNVVRLYDVFPQGGGAEALHRKYYIRGVGSLAQGQRVQALGREAATSTGQAVAHNPTPVGLIQGAVASLTSLGGYVAEVGYDIAGKAGGLGGKNRLNMAYEWLSARCGEVAPTGERTVDIFGFSRGAAMARTFVNLVNMALKRAHPLLRVRFLGIFDTVGSFGMAGDDSDPGQNLGINQTDAMEIAHYTARHEYRGNFPLTLISPECDKPYPGCHSDVGGSYPPKDSDGKVNHLGHVTFVDMYDALSGLMEKLHAGCCVLAPAESAIALSRAQVQEVKNKKAPEYAQMQGQEKEWTEAERKYYDEYIHQSHLLLSDWWKLNQGTNLISNQIDRLGRRREFQNPRQQELDGMPPDFDWK